MNLIYYLLEANLYLVVFYLLYFFLLRKETYYQFGRIYLLGTSLLAFIIPVVQLGFLKPNSNVQVTLMPNIAVGNIQTQVLTNPAPGYTLYDYCLWAYIATVIVLLASLCIKIFKLIRLLKTNISHPYNGFTLVEINGNDAAFSFFNYLFVNPQLINSSTIMHHEQVHIKQKHSWDILYLELLKVFNWFNPFVYLLQNSIKEIHEFIADHHTAALENDNDHYADFLIGNAYGRPYTSLINPFFNKNLLKRRIMMLYQKRSGKTARLKYLLALPLVGALLCVSTMAFTTKNYGWINISPKHIATVVLQNNTLRHPYSPGNLIASLPAANTNHAEQNPVVDAKQIQQKTGRVSDNPIKTSQNLNDTGKIKKPPLVFIDGKPVSLAEGEDVKTKLNGIDPNTIKSIDVLKGKDAASEKEIINKYGAGAVNGVILITTKNASDNTNNTPTSGVLLNPPPQQSNNDPIYTAVTKQPVFPGGTQAFYTFMGQTIRYPKEDKMNNIQGRVIVQFVVEKDGSLTSFNVLRSPSPTLADEAVRALKLSPAWTPGTQNDKPVRVQYTVPVTFSLGK